VTGRATAERRALRLLRWYPKAWRLRYGGEFTQLLIDHMAERPRSWQRTLDVARCGLAARTALQRRSRPRLAVAAAVIGVVASSDIWIATYKSLNAEGRSYAYGIPPYVSQATLSRAWPHFFSTPTWVVPSALGIGLLGLTAAAVLLRLRLIAAVLTLGAALAGGVGLYEYLNSPHQTLALARPDWVGPSALAILLLGFAAAARVLVAARHRDP
jgi:hypothetical protein